LNRGAVSQEQADKVINGWWEGNNKSGESLISSLGGGEEASKKLKELGIPGIQYYDGMSRSAGKGTRNYVMFDDELISINQPKSVRETITDAAKGKK